MYPTLTVEVALGVGTGGYLILDDPALGQLDVGLLGPDLVWTPISAYVTLAETHSATRDRVLNGFTGGWARFELVNTDSRFDPTNTTGPYALAGVSTLRAGRPVRVLATWAGVTYPLWYGYAESWQPDGHPVATRSSTLQCADAFKVLSGLNRTAKAAQGAGELAGERVQRILDDAGWSSTLRDIAAGQSPMAATTLADNALAELHLTAASENGVLFVDALGRVVFHDRHRQMTNPRANTPVATWAHAATGGELAPHAMRIRTDDELLVNQFDLARVGGTQQTAFDGTSVAVNTQGVPRSWGRSDLLLTTDTEVAAAAAWLLAQHKDPETRFAGLTARPAGNSPAAQWPVVLGAQLRDRWTCINRPRGGAAYSADVFVDGIHHTYSVDTGGRVEWRADFDLTSASAYGGFMVLDHPTLGVLDTNLIAY